MLRLSPKHGTLRLPNDDGYKRHLPLKTNQCNKHWVYAYQHGHPVDVLKPLQYRTHIRATRAAFIKNVEDIIGTV